MTTPPLSPWRRTTRTVFQAIVGLAVMLPILISETGLKTDQVPWLAGVLVVCAAVTRIMAIPAVEQFLQRVLPWLSAAPKRTQRGAVDVLLLLAIATLLGVVLLLFRVHIS